jgi:hypothetical protein
MILRPLDPTTTAVVQKTSLEQPASTENQLAPAWQIVEQVQRATYETCWIITQPSHAALAGDIAAELVLPGLPKLEADVVRAISLHDAGWGMPDARAVMRSRAGGQEVPRSFIQCTVAELVSAWTQSIDIAQTTSPAGGYIVSRHFWRLAEHRLAAGQDTKPARSQIKDFLDDEMERQKELAAKQKRNDKELEALTDALQFCDLVSLYICCGAQVAVEFPECCGTKVRMKVEGSKYRFDPAVVVGPSEFPLAALHHPATKQVSGQEIVIALS